MKKTIANKLLDSLYVDNCVTSVNTKDELNAFICESVRLLSKGHFNLRDWRWNQDDLASSTTNFDVSVLGLSCTDTLTVVVDNVVCVDKRVTKRVILSCAHRVLDLIGFTCPVTVVPKSLLQKSWSLKVGWDDELPEEITKEFHRWSEQVAELKKIKILRWLVGTICDCKLSFLVFADVSSYAYAAVVFIRVDTMNTVSVQRGNILMKHLNDKELRTAEMSLFKLIQAETYCAESHHIGDHPAVVLLIKKVHEELSHAGVQMVMCNLTETFWIQARRTIRKVVVNCAKCRRFDCTKIKTTPPPLPVDRIRSAAAFEVTGIDMAGPLYLKKDNGLGFQGSRNLLKTLDWEKACDLSLGQSHSIHPIDWRFNPPSGPWWGGWWERFIGLSKNILKRVLGRACLNYEELLTVLCDCESVLNSRPLTYVSEESDDLIPLTPAMLLREVRESGLPELDDVNSKSLNRRLKY
ncbi:unnamed protein product [Allacma fusca]|uniref:Integrase zinc-binding domain-containing protein n=1 Tax=Allacma fusca TaxID=39272 RepID=A0A8J2JFI6_9HEXA|nr:unnamed protein product [Allacma fusca]